MTPDLDRKSIRSDFDASGDSTAIEIVIFFDGKELTRVTCKIETAVIFDEIHGWSPECPSLHDVLFHYGEDTVTSYFAMWSIEIERAKDGRYRFFLNGKSYFCDGLLDQGYWSDGLYTALCEDEILFDMLNSKKLG